MDKRPVGERGDAQKASGTLRKIPARNDLHFTICNGQWQIRPEPSFVAWAREKPHGFWFYNWLLFFFLIPLRLEPVTP